MPVLRRSLLVAAAGLTLLASGVLPAGASQPEGQVRDAGGSIAIPGSYVVVFKDTAVSRARVGSAARRLAARQRAAVTRAYTAGLRGFEVRTTEQGAKRMAADPAVAYVEQNHLVRVTGATVPPSWGLDRIDQRALPLDNSYAYPQAKAVVHAYVIDTGLRFTHAAFGGRAVSGFDAVDGGAADDCNGHGTHVGATLGGSPYGVDRNVRLVAVRVLDCTGSGTIAQVIAGIDWVTANAVKPAVANMSLGGAASLSLDDAVRRSISAGITYGVAAGNGDAHGLAQPACNYSPARVTEAITVGATDSLDRAAGFSNYGPCVDILAPGVGITSAWYSDDTATAVENGTSMATPHVVGAAALLLGLHPTWTPQQVRDHLVQAATPNVVLYAGTGTPNLLLYVPRTAAPLVRTRTTTRVPAVIPGRGTGTAPSWY